MSQTLFDNFIRTDNNPAKYNASFFDYLNNSSREHCIKSRKLLDEWFRQYAKRHGKIPANELRTRFRSKRNDEHFSALTELYLHNFLLSNGFNIKIHPKISKNESRPDFLILKNRRKLFYLEAKVISGRKDKKQKTLFENKILDAVDEISSPKFLISVSFKKSSEKSLPHISKIKKLLQKKVDSLDYQAVCKEYEKNRIFPKFVFQNNDWEIEFEFTPVKEECFKERKVFSRNIGATSHPASAIHLDDEIKKSVRNKLYKYKNLKLPFILAVNIISDSIFLDDYTIMAALFGKMQIVFSTFPDGTTKTSPTRTMDGILLDPKHGTIGTRLSALLVLNDLHFGNASSLSPVIWHNPHSKNKLSPELLKAKHMIYNEKSERMELMSN